MGGTEENKLNKTSLIGLVIGSMIGGGAFNIISDMGRWRISDYFRLAHYCSRYDFTCLCLSKLNE
ncbi:hypothetical protein JPSP13_15940 [Staphylococcus pseudintermedius]